MYTYLVHVYVYSIVLCTTYAFIVLKPFIMCFYSSCMDVLKMMQLREKHIQQFGVVRQTKEW